MSLSRAIWKLFPPYEVQVTRGDINSFLTADNGLCAERVRREALHLTNDAVRVVHSIRVDHRKPDELALILIHNVLVRNLEGGGEHVYRGALGIVGQDMLRLWTATQKEMLKRGYQTETEYTAEASELRMAIREVG